MRRAGLLLKKACTRDTDELVVDCEVRRKDNFDVAFSADGSIKSDVDPKSGILAYAAVVVERKGDVAESVRLCDSG